MTPSARGVATDIDTLYRLRQENTALAFNGFINISNAGAYTFHLTTDDGGYLYVGNPAASCGVTVLGRKSVPEPRPFTESLPDREPL